MVGHGTPLTRMMSPHSPLWPLSLYPSEPSGVEQCVGEHQRHVELALGQLRPLETVRERVEPGQSGVHVLGSDVVLVVVVPKRAGCLPVGIVVVLDEAGTGDVIGIAVVLGQRRRAVQVRGGAECPRLEQAGLRERVADPHLGPGALLRPDGRAREDSVVPRHCGGRGPAACEPVPASG